jgi:hypothetical protein
MHADFAPSSGCTWCHGSHVQAQYVGQQAWPSSHSDLHIYIAVAWRARRRRTVAAGGAAANKAAHQAAHQASNQAPNQAPN